MRRLILLILPLVAVIAGAAFYVFQPSEHAGTKGTASSTKDQSGKAGSGQTASASGALGVVKPETPTASSDLPKTLRAVVEMAPGLERRQKLEKFGFDEAAKDPETALKQLAMLRGADRSAYLRGMFEQFAMLPPAQALSWAKRLEKGPDRDLALQSLMGTWRAGDAVNPAEEAQLIQRFGVAEGLGFRLLNGKYKDPALAALWAQEMTAGRGQAQLLGAAAALMAQTDPAKAMELGNSLQGDDRAQFLRSMVFGWGNTAPDDAWRWAANIPDSQERAMMQSSLIREMARTNGAQAAERLNQMAAGDDKNRATVMLAAGWASMSPQEALAWVQTLPADQQKQAMDVIGRVAQPGIGVSNMRPGDDGYLHVGGIVPGSPASGENGLKPNDKILAVSDGKGGMIQAKGLQPQQFTEQIRNQANAKITMQVANENGETRMVELTPELIGRRQAFQGQQQDQTQQPNQMFFGRGFGGGGGRFGGGGQGGGGAGGRGGRAGRGGQ